MSINVYKFPLFLAAILISLQINSKEIDDYNIVLISDTTAIGASINNNSILDGRYVLVNTKIINLFDGDRKRISSAFTYAVDCAAPKKIALIVSQFNLETSINKEPRWGISFEKEEYESGFNLKNLGYLKVEEINENRMKMVEDAGEKRLKKLMPEDTNLAVEYACRVAINLESAKSVSDDLIKNGGVNDLKNLICDTTFRNGDKISINVSFSEKSGFLKVNDKWKITPFINSEYMGYSALDKSKMIINRINGQLTLSSKNNTQIASGMCNLASEKKKF
jgi:hypothetical protein